VKLTDHAETVSRRTIRNPRWVLGVLGFIVLVLLLVAINSLHQDTEDLKDEVQTNRVLIIRLRHDVNVATGQIAGIRVCDRALPKSANIRQVRACLNRVARGDNP